jgi:hypothetical protein
MDNSMSAGDGTTPGVKLTRQEAQGRADQIAAFMRELQELERDGILALSGEDRDRAARYHAALLGEFGRRFDVDANEGQRRMSLGMRIASLLGAATLSAGVVLFFYRIWGSLATWQQVAVLAAVPLGALAAVEAAARREKTLYVASVLAVLSGAAFVLNLSVVGAIFNLPPTPWVLLPWAVFALVVAYGYGLRMMLAAGLLLAASFVNALIADAVGIELGASIARPEPFVLLGGLLFACSFTVAGSKEGFARTLRLVGVALGLLPLLFLSVWTVVFSYVAGPQVLLHAVYDGAGLALPVLGIWTGIRRRWSEVVNACAAFLVLFIYAKCFDWWWTVMPRYLFFLMLGGLAIAALVLMGRLRARVKQV